MFYVQFDWRSASTRTPRLVRIGSIHSAHSAVSTGTCRLWHMAHKNHKYGYTSLSCLQNGAKTHIAVTSTFLTGIKYPSSELQRVCVPKIIKKSADFWLTWVIQQIKVDVYWDAVYTRSSSPICDVLCVIRHLDVLTKYRRVKDRQTDRQTDRRTDGRTQDL